RQHGQTHVDSRGLCYCSYGGGVNLRNILINCQLRECGKSDLACKVKTAADPLDQCEVRKLGGAAHQIIPRTQGFSHIATISTMQNTSLRLQHGWFLAEQAGRNLCQQNCGSATLPQRGQP